MKLGMAGLGWLGEALIKDAVHLPEFDVIAVQDVLGDRAREIAERYSVDLSFEQYEDLVCCPGVDVVAICTPNSLHATQAQMALGRGKDVLVQKPLALSAADADQTVSLAEQTGRVLFVDYTYRFLATMAALRDRVDGNIRSMRAAFHNVYGPGADKPWFFNPAQAGGGALTDLGVHLLDLGLWLTQPNTVVLEGSEVSNEQPVEHSATLSLRLDDVPFHLEVSWNAPLPAAQIWLEVDTGSEMVRWENVDGSFFHFRTVCDGSVLLDRETTLREDTLRALAAALAGHKPPPIDTRVYALLDRAYGRGA